MLEGVSDSKWRRIAGRGQTFGGADVTIGDSTIPCKQMSIESTPKWRAPAVIFGIGETGAAAKFQSQTSKIARYCARERIVTAPDDPVCGRNAARLDDVATDRGMWKCPPTL